MATPANWIGRDEATTIITLFNHPGLQDRCLDLVRIDEEDLSSFKAAIRQIDRRPLADPFPGQMFTVGLFLGAILCQGVSLDTLLRILGDDD